MSTAGKGQSVDELLARLLPAPVDPLLALATESMQAWVGGSSLLRFREFCSTDSRRELQQNVRDTLQRASSVVVSPLDVARFMVYLSDGGFDVESLGVTPMSMLSWLTAGNADIAYIYLSSSGLDTAKRQSCVPLMSFSAL